MIVDATWTRATLPCGGARSRADGRAVSQLPNAESVPIAPRSRTSQRASACYVGGKPIASPLSSRFDSGKQTACAMPDKESVSSERMFKNSFRSKEQSVQQHFSSGRSVNDSVFLSPSPAERHPRQSLSRSKEEQTTNFNSSCRSVPDFLGVSPGPSPSRSMVKSSSRTTVEQVRLFSSPPRNLGTSQSPCRSPGAPPPVVSRQIEVGSTSSPADVGSSPIPTPLRPFDKARSSSRATLPGCGPEQGGAPCTEHGRVSPSVKPVRLSCSGNRSPEVPAEVKLDSSGA